MKKFKAKSHHWHSGKLEIRIELFESFEEAVNYAKEIECVVVKIFNEFNELLLEIIAEEHTTYA